MKSNNITDWKKNLSDPDCPYLSKSWEDCKPFVALCLKSGQPDLWVDLGCGLGYFGECCQKFGIKCDGLEGDEHAVKLAQERCPSLSVKKYNITDKLPYEDKSVSVVFCHQVLEHLPPESTIDFLSEVRRILKPGGMFFVNTPSKFSPGPYGKDQPDHINMMVPSELNGALLKAGFNDIWPANYPRFIFGKSTIAKTLAGALFCLFPFDRFSNISTAICFLTDKPESRIRSSRYFHMKRILGW